MLVLNLAVSSGHKNTTQRHLDRVHSLIGPPKRRKPKHGRGPFGKRFFHGFG